MPKTIIPFEMGIRLGLFLGVLFLMALWEILLPKRQLTIAKARRWFSNLGIVVISSLLVRLVLPAGAVGFALYGQTENLGLLHHLTFPTWLQFILGIVILDLAIYGQHVMFHYVPIFWRFHRMHHLDLDIDTTTGVRFHPVEIILSILIKGAVILLIGIMPIAVLIFEIILNATSLFNHGNVRLFSGLDKLIRLFIVTPDMHRVHHSVYPNETNSNFGFNFSCWDRIFRTYHAQPKDGHSKMHIGLSDERRPKYCVNLLGILIIPFIYRRSKKL